MHYTLTSFQTLKKTHNIIWIIDIIKDILFLFAFTINLHPRVLISLLFRESGKKCGRERERERKIEGVQ